MTEAAFWTPIVAATAALSGVYLQSYLSRKQTFRSRLWDLQREAYGEILSGMTEAEHHCSDMLFVCETLHLADLNPMTGTTPELSKVLERYTEAVGAVRRRLARERLILPAGFIEIYEEFAEASRKLDIDTAVTPFRVRQMKSLIRSSRVKLEDAARLDLNEPR